MVVSPLMADKIRQASEEPTSLNVEDLNALVKQIHSEEKPIKAD